LFDLSLRRELTELLGKSLTFKDVETIGSDLFRSYNTHELEKISHNVSISPLNAAKRLVDECERKNKLKELFSLVIQLDDNLLNGRLVKLKNLENLLYHISKTGIYFDFDKHKFVNFSEDKEYLANWGSLKEGKEYSLTVASVDICGNSKLVRKHKQKVMEKVYFELWEYLKSKLSLYDGRIWSWAGDGGILAFRKTAKVSQSVRCCLEILLSLPSFNLMPAKPIKDDIVLRVGMDTGKIKFMKDTGRIVSEVINYAAHLEKKGTEPNGLSISETVYKGLTPELKKVFKTQQVFESRKAYSLVYDCHNAFQ
jgi:class 3 adenylate cyclase